MFNERMDKMITNKHLLIDRPHTVSGVQRIYKFKDGNGLSVVNCEILHGYPFAWEIAVLSNVRKNIFGEVIFDNLRYDTPLTDDVEVFSTDEEANEFIEKAAQYFGSEE